jgi:hypothetical protein
MSSGLGAVVSHAVRQTPSTQRVPSQSASVRQKGLGAFGSGLVRGRQKSWGPQTSVSASQPASQRRRHVPSTQLVVKSGQSLLSTHSPTMGWHRAFSHLVPVGQWVAGPHSNRQRLFAQLKPAAHWKSNWQVSSMGVHRFSMQSVPALQSASVRQLPSTSGRQESRKSHSNPDAQSPSLPHSAMAGM